MTLFGLSGSRGPATMRLLTSGPGEFGQAEPGDTNSGAVRSTG